METAFLLLLFHRRWQHFGVGISLRQFEQMKDRVAGKTSRDSVLPTTPHDRLATSV